MEKSPSSGDGGGVMQRIVSQTPVFLTFRHARQWRPRYSCSLSPAFKDPPLQVTRILAVRHGETAWNRDTRIQGHTDIALNERGRWQAAQLAEALRDEPIAAVYASDLGRAFETAQAVARVKNLSVTPHQGLRERHFGVSKARPGPSSNSAGRPRPWPGASACPISPPPAANRWNSCSAA